MSVKTSLKTVKNVAAERYPTSVGTLVAAIGRVASREQRDLRIWYDGQDWVHTWADGVLTSEQPSTFPHRTITGNLALFTERFMPSEGQTIVDVGAGIGTEVLAFSKMVGDSGRVICIEADPRAFRCLGKTVARAGLRNVTLIHRAVTDCEGEISLSQGSTTISNSILADGGAGITVRSTTLDSLLDEFGVEYVDYLKMNIEGAEVRALEGFTTGPRRVRNWCISCHDFKNIPELETFDQVKRWLNGHELTVSEHKRNDARPWESYYLYACSN